VAQEVRTAADSVIPICHQYDRFPDIREVVEKRFSAGLAEFDAGHP
jgi:hypothetical protein